MKSQLPPPAPGVVVTAGGGKRARPLPLQIGARVAILGHKHLKCAAHGFVQWIDGAYIMVRPDDAAVVPAAPTAHCLELYPNELKVVAVYSHDTFSPGSVVRIKDFQWGKLRPRTYGIVVGVEASRLLLQPVGSPAAALISVAPPAVDLEWAAATSDEARRRHQAMLNVLAAESELADALASVRAAEKRLAEAISAAGQSGSS